MFSLTILTLYKERSKRIELQFSDSTSRLQHLEIENKRIVDLMKRKLDETSLKERNEFGLKLSLAERRAAQAESDLLKAKQQLRLKEEDEVMKKRPSIDTRHKIDPMKTERTEPIGAERDDDRTSEIMSFEQIIESPNRTFSVGQRSEGAAVNELSDQLKKTKAKFWV